MKTKLATLFVLLILFSCASDFDDNLKSEDLINNNPVEIILVDSELYNHLELIIDDTIEVITPITCIEFIYPITMFTFDENLDVLPTTIIQNDLEFSAFLASLQSTYSISLSYPITTTLEDGTTFSINNNNELRENIDACIEEIQEEIIRDCEALITSCVWKVGYTQDTENTYLGGIFQEANGATTFTYNNITYFGSWTVLFIEEELHINISLTNSEDINEHFNLDWKVEYLDENSIKLTNDDQVIILDQYCNADYTQCNNLSFTACELENNPDVGEFILNDYNFCINTILQTEPLNTNIIYFETIDNANNNENSIAIDQVYLNTSNSQTIYVRIENIEGETYFIIEIIIKVESC